MKARPPGPLLIVLGIVAVAALAGPDRAVPRSTLPAVSVALSQDAPSQVAPLGEPPSRMAAVDPRLDPPASPQAVTRRTASVSVSSGRVRGGPSLQARQIGSLPRGTAVVIVGENGEWLSIEAPTRRITGWMHRSTLATGGTEAETQYRATATRQPVPKKQPVAVKSTVVSRRLSDNDIRQAIIRQSIVSYYGSCPCPYNVDRGGRLCGDRSAYSRPGGEDPICYPDDVTASMIERFRAAPR